jgi:hypothetical protein
MQTPDLKLLKSLNPVGVVYYYAMPDANEAIVLRTLSADGGGPQSNEPYSIEFCHPSSGEVLEVLDAEDSRRFDPSAIREVMAQLAEDYLRSTVSDWENYVAQSGRCSPSECNPGIANNESLDCIEVRGAVA